MVFRPAAIEKKGLELAALQGKSSVVAPAAGTEQEGRERYKEKDMAAGASRVLGAEPTQHCCYLHDVCCLSQLVQAGEHFQSLIWEARNKTAITNYLKVHSCTTCISSKLLAQVYVTLIFIDSFIEIFPWLLQKKY